MKKSTLIACIVLVAGLLTWYFIQNSKKNKVEVSVVGTNCEKTTPEIYLLIMNSSEKEILRDIQLTFSDKETNQKSTIPYTMKRAVKAREFRQDTVFVPTEIYNFDCQGYEINVKMKKK